MTVYHNLVENETCVVSEASVRSRLRWCCGAVVLSLLSALAVFASLLEVGGGGATSPVLVCYYTLDGGPLEPSALDPRLCTHINAAFARVVHNQVYLSAGQRHALRQLVVLRTAHPALKVLLSVGGAGDDDGFPEMVADHATRKIFIRSIKSILRNYTLDGIDLDWEFPALHDVGRKTGRERQHFSQLLREIRAEYVREKRDYLLTVAVAAQETIVDVSYDVDQLDLYVDYVNVMSYDYHFYSRLTPFCGLNAPLYSPAGARLFPATLSINYTVHMYLSRGLARDKLVLGVPTYGHTFTLVNPDNTHVGSPSSGFGTLGSQGFVDYPDVCRFVKDYSSEVTIQQDNESKVPYLFRNSEWVSYDCPHSVKEKAKYIKKFDLRGAMVYSLNSDDYLGVCEGDLGNNDKFPLANSIKSVLLDNY